MFNAISYNTFFLVSISLLIFARLFSQCQSHLAEDSPLPFEQFGALNFAVLPTVWAFYPETAGRTLEEIDVLFVADSPFVWRMSKTLKHLEEADPRLTQAIKSGDASALEKAMLVARGDERAAAAVAAGAGTADADVISRSSAEGTVAGDDQPTDEKGAAAKK